MTMDTGRMVMALIRRLAIESEGEDVIEYALLTAFIGFSGAVGWSAIQTGLGAAYNSWVTGVWNLWEPANPVGAP
jgi:Flp pilus assembly pilin Flp